MSIKLQFSSLSLGASVDQQTGHLSVFDVIEEIRVPQLPVQLQTLVIALVLQKTIPQAVSGKMLIHLLPPGESPVLVGQGPLDIPPEQARMKAVFRFGGFPLAHFGDYRIVVSFINESGKKEGEALLDFSVVKATQVAQGVPPTEKPPVSH